MLITAIDMVVSWVGASVLYLKCPSLFPAMAKAQGRKMEVTKYSIPLGLMFAVSLYASHQAYLYCSVTFLHFVKEANTVLIFWLSDPEGLQVSSSHTGGGGGFCLSPPSRVHSHGHHHRADQPPPWPPPATTTATTKIVLVEPCWWRPDPPTPGSGVRGC